MAEAPNETAARSPTDESGPSVAPDAVIPGHASSLPRVSAVGKSDKPTKRDLLDRKIYVTAIAALILNEKTQAPLTIGIYGPWGSGKSSFLTQLTERLPKHYPVASFNPWRMSGGGEVWAGLVNEIAPIIDRHLGPLQRIRFLWSADSTRSVSKLHTRLAAASKKIGNWLTLAAASGGFLAVGSLKTAQLPEFITSGDGWLAGSVRNALGWVGTHDLSKVKWDVVVGVASMAILLMVILYKLLKTWFRPFSTQFKANLSQFKDKSQELKNATFKDFEALRKVIGDFTTQQTKSHKPHLVLLIDDLDRCTPDRVVGVLEAVNSFIAELPIITVFAIDTKFVCNAVAARYRFLFAPQEGIDARERYGRLFLEKIIHIPFQLPAVGNYERYIEELLTISDDDTDGKLSEAADTVVPLPRVAELLEGRKGYQRALLALLALYLKLIVFAVARKGDADRRWGYGISMRMLFGLGLTVAQREWLANQEYVTQITFKIQEAEFTGPPLNFQQIMRMQQIMARARQEVLSTAIKIQESDRAILRRHTMNLRGNPRSIKRFVNTYLLAKGITALTPSDQFDEFRLDNLACWLVLLQNWPELGSVLCSQAQNNIQTAASFFCDGWLKRSSIEKAPTQMLTFIDSNKDRLERLISSPHGLDIARCFSFFIAEL